MSREFLPKRNSQSQTDSLQKKKKINAEEHNKVALIPTENIIQGFFPMQNTLAEQMAAQQKENAAQLKQQQDLPELKGDLAHEETMVADNTTGISADRSEEVNKKIDNEFGFWFKKYGLDSESNKEKSTVSEKENNKERGNIEKEETVPDILSYSERFEDTKQWVLANNPNWFERNIVYSLFGKISYITGNYLTDFLGVVGNASQKINHTPYDDLKKVVDSLDIDESNKRVLKIYIDHRKSKYQGRNY